MKPGNFTRLFLFSILFFFGLSNGFANDYFWVGGSGNWSEASTHWATSSGGSQFYGQVPQTGDNVYFDANSFSAPGQRVMLDVSGYCNNMDWTGVTNNPVLATLNTSTSTLNVYGSLRFVAGMHIDFQSGYNGVHFLATNQGQTINLGGNRMESIFFEGGGGGWKFMDTFNGGQIMHTNGTLDFNGQTVNLTYFNSNGTGATLITGAASINVSFAWNYYGNVSSDFSSSVLTLANGGQPVQFFGGGCQYYYVVYKNSGAINGNNSYHSMTFIPGANYDVSGTQTILGSFNATGTCTAFITLNGSATISKGSGSISISYVNLNNIHGSGGAVFTALNSFDGGNNTGWQISTAAGKNLYWVGGAGNWSDGSHWSLTSGGSPLGCSPNQNDNVRFDANSFSAAGQRVMLDVSGYCNNMDWTGVTNNPVLATINSSTSTLNVYGSLRFVAGMHIDFQSGYNGIHFLATNQGQTINLGGNRMESIFFEGGGGGWKFMDTFNGGQIMHTNGTLDFNGQTVNLTYFNSNGTGATLITGAASINVSFGWNYYGNISSDFSSSVLTLANGGQPVQFNGGGCQYYDVVYKNSGTINGNNRYHSMTFIPGANYDVSGTQTILGSFNATGTCTAFITLNGSATISKGSGSISISYVNLNNIHGSGGAVFTALNSFDGGNNTGWQISTAAGKNLYWVGGAGNWSDGSHWSLTSGGSPLGCSPNQNDNVRFDANSFSAAGQRVMLDVSGYCNNMDWTGVTNNPVLATINSSTSTLNVYGSLRFVAGMHIDFQSGYNGIHFLATNQGQTINLGGNRMESIFFEGAGGGWKFMDTFNGGQIMHTNGTLDFNGQTVNLTYFNSNGAGATLITGAAAINVSFAWNYYGNISSDFSSSVLTLANGGQPVQFFGGGCQYYDVVYKNSGAINGNNRYHSMTFIPGASYDIDGTQTILGSFNATGTTTLLVSLNGLNAHAVISQNGGSVCIDYTLLKNISSSGGAIFNAGLNSTDLGGNTGWNFASAIAGSSFAISSNSHCLPNPISFSASSISQLSSPNYMWLVNNIPVQSGSGNSYAGSNLQAGDQVKCIVSANFCGSSISFTSNSITVMAALPQVHITAKSGICEGGVLSLTTDAVAGATYHWTGPNNFSSSQQNPVISSITAAAGGTYQLQVVDGNGCTSSATKDVSVIALPTLNTISSQTICNGSTFTGLIFTGSANRFTWTNDKPTIGLPTNGTGSLPPFIATNTGTDPVTATINVTPFKQGYAYILAQGLGDNLSYSTIAAINTTTHTIDTTLLIGPAAQNATGICINPAGNRIYVSEQLYNSVGVINTQDNSIIATIPVGRNPSGLCVSPDGNKIYVACPTTNNVYVIDANLLQVIAIIPVSLFPHGIAISPDGSKIYVTKYGSASVSVINALTNTEITSIGVGDAPKTLVISPDGQRLYVGNTGSSFLSVINTTNNTLLTNISLSGVQEGISISPDGSRVYASTNNNSIAVINTSNNSLFTTIPLTSPTRGNSITPDGSELYVFGPPNVTVISTATNSVSQVIQQVGFNGVSLGNFISASGCPAPATAFTITVNPIPAASITVTGSQTVCSGETVQLSANTGTGFTYQWLKEGVAIDGANSATYHANATGNYAVTVISNGCSKTSDPVLITVNPLPVVTISSSGSTEFCFGGSVVLTSSAGSSYVWSNGATTQSTTVSSTGNYSVTVTNGNGCSSTSAATAVTVYALPTVTIMASGPTEFCAGGSVVLTASAGSSYVWSNGETTQSITVSTPGNYSVTVTNVNGCSATSAVTAVTVNALPTATITAFGSTAFCAGGSVTLTSSAGSSYVWSNGETTQTIIVSTAGNYSVTVTNENGCSSTSAATAVTVNALPTVTIMASGPIEFCSGGSVVLTASAGANYQWSNGETTQTITVSTSGSYSVMITNANGCSATSTATAVAVYTLPTVTIMASGPIEFCSGGSVALTASAGASYLWSNGETTQSNAASTAGNYSVTVTNENGCSATSAATAVTVYALPTVTITASGPTIFCAGGAVALTASAGSTYLWSNGETTQSIAVSTSGNYSVTVTNGNGCSSTSPATAVMVNSVPAAIITVSNIVTCSVRLTANTAGGLTYQWFLNGTAIAGSTASVYTARLTGSYTVTEILNGCSTTSAATSVVISDNIPPVAKAKNITVQLTAAGTVSVTAAQVNNASTDNCTVAKLQLDKTVFDCSNVGNNTVVLTVTDGAGNASSASAIVTVQDLVKPVVLTKNISVQLDQAGSASITAAQVNNGSTDNCGIASVSVSPSSFTCANLGANTVTLTVTDVNGNVATRTAVVTVQDLRPPTVITKNITIQLGSTGTVTITAAQVDNGSTDNCTIASMTVAPLSFNCTKVGVNTVTLTVKDSKGNVSSGTALVTVIDLTPPVVLTKNVTVVLTSAGAASITTAQVNNASTDNCGIATFSLNKANFDCSNIGNNTVILTATDAAGNSSAAPAVVTVLDNSKPVVLTKNVTVQLDASGAASVTAAQVDNGSTDNCSIASMSVSPASFTCANVGNNTVTLTVTDVSGNTATKTAVVAVQDLLPPVARAQDIVVALNAAGTATITAAQVNNGSTDNCGITTMSVSPASFSCANVGANSVTLTVKDAKGNTSSTTAILTVIDTVPPVVITRNISVALTSLGTVTITPAQVNNGSTDRCGILTMTLDKTIFSCSDIGANTVTLTITDVHGNVSTGTAVVTVTGEIPTVTISSVPTTTTYTGGIATNLYLGYGATGTSLKVAAPASGAPYTYLWSGTGTLNNYTSSAPVFTPGAAGSYSFTVTAKNKFGCTTTSSISICVTDIRVTGMAGKVYVCNGGQSIVMATTTVASYLTANPTARLGSCDQTACQAVAVNSSITGPQKTEVEKEVIRTTDEILKVTVMPNPTTTYFTLKLESNYETPVNMRVMDGRGRVVEARSKMGANSTIQIGHGYSSGTYYAELIQGNIRKVVQLIKGRG